MRRILSWLVLLVLAGACIAPAPARSGQFSGARAYELVAEQMEFGPRHPGSPGHTAVQTWIEAGLRDHGWDVARQPFEHQGTSLANIIGHGAGQGERLYLIGAHYDTRPLADEEPLPDPGPVPGANDGGSGVAVLLELARVLPAQDLSCRVQLVFFDAEDSGRLPGWDWILGSSYFAEHMQETPAAVVIVDLVGDAELELYRERNSTPELTDELWGIGRELGYQAFIDEPRYSIIDDHTPFLRRGVPAVDIIDFDYPYWHTEEDTLDKLAPESLMAVGHTVQHWLERTCGQEGPV